MMCYYLNVHFQGQTVKGLQDCEGESSAFEAWKFSIRGTDVNS